MPAPSDGAAPERRPAPKKGDGDATAAMQRPTVTGGSTPGLPTPWRSDDPNAAIPWPDARTALRFELLPNFPPRPNQGAFVALSKDGAHSQVLLGRIAAGDAVLSEVAFVVQKDRYGSDEGVNPRIEAKLLRKRDALRRLGAETDAAPRLLDVFAPDADLGRALPSPPLLFCMKKTAFFHPRCGTCGDVLRDCRSDGMLLSINAKIASEGRPGRIGTFTESTERHLHCPACSAKAGVPPVLYVRAFTGEHRTPEAFAGRVKNQLGLFRDMGAAMHEGRLDASHLPCATCEHRSLCYPATQLESSAPGKQYVLEVVRPLSFHDFVGYVSERLDLRYDHAAQLMGGRSLDEVEAALPYRDQPAAVERFRTRVKASLAGGRGLLYGDDAGLRGLEVLRGKLALFTDLCRAVRETHRVTGPHLDLRPENIMTVTGDPAPGVPALWNLRVKVLGAGGAAPAFEGRPGFPKDLFEAPDDVDPAYAPAVLREHGESAKPFRVRSLVIGSVDRTAEGVVLKVELSGPGTPADLGEKDRVVAVLETDDQTLVDLAVCLRPDGRGDAAPKTTVRLAALSDPLALEDWQVESLRELVGVPFANVKCRLYRRLHVPCDLYALGALLLQTLLETLPESEGGDGRGTAALRDAAVEVVDRAAATLKAERPSGRVAEADLAPVVLALLAEEDDAWRALDPAVRASRTPPWFARENVFYDKRTRDDAAAETIPRDLFHDALLVAMRLVSRVRGFSYAADDSDYDPARPEAKLDAVLRDLGRLNEKVRGQMFGAARLNRDVHRALNDLRTQSGTTLFGGGTILISNAEEEARERAEALAAEIDRTAAGFAGAPDELFAKIRDLVRAELEQSQGVCDPTVLCDEIKRRYPYVDENSRRDGARVAELLAACTEIVSKARDVAFGAEGPGSTQFVVGAADPAAELKRALRIVEILGFFVDAADAMPDTFAEVEQIKAARDRRFGRVRGALQTWFSTAAAGDARDHARLSDAIRRVVTLQKDVPLRLAEAYSFAIRRGLRDVLGRFKPTDEKGFFGRKEELERLTEAFAQLSAQLESEPLALLRRYFDPHFRQKFDELASTRKRESDPDGVAPTRLAEAEEDAGGGAPPPKRRR